MPVEVFVAVLHMGIRRKKIIGRGKSYLGRFSISVPSKAYNTHDWNNDKPYECGLKNLDGG